MRITLSLSVILLVSSAQSQITSNKLERNLKSHIHYLASDSLEGRRAGTNGEYLAAEYISTQFKNSRISYYNKNTNYFQNFEIFDGYGITAQSSFMLNQLSLVPNKDFFFLPFSAMSAHFIGEVFPTLNENNNYWILDISDYLKSIPSSPHNDIYSQLRNFSKNAQNRGASGLILYSSDSTLTNFSPTDKFGEPLDIPVLYILNAGPLLEELSKNVALKVNLSLNLQKKFRQSKNVIGYINNKKSETIILGAHYDHLGYGEDGNIMNKAAIGQIHNGADDNASGTSALIELSKYLKKRRYRNYNYILIAFSAEELGLLGSKYFVENHDFLNEPIKFMINMDMIGRLNDSSKSMTIGGYGTSKDWHDILTTYKKSDLLIKFDSSGTGPSDHTSFYRKNIPVLFYFTGLHSDYHKPTDDASRINYKGVQSILKHILYVTESSIYYTLKFQKTKEQPTSTNTRFSVSLGIMPDYSFNGNGVRVDGISEGKLAQKIRLQAGDILVRLGSNNITSIESYMKVLSAFKKGDATELEYLRNEKSYSVQIIF